MVKGTDPGEANRCLPPVCELLKSFIFGLALCYKTTEFGLTWWISKLNVGDPFCADANLKFDSDISIGLGDMIKETSPGEVIRCQPPVTEFLKSFTFCLILYYEVTEFIQSNNLFVSPFCADVKLKYEICISNGFREMVKEIA